MSAWKPLDLSFTMLKNGFNITNETAKDIQVWEPRKVSKEVASVGPTTHHTHINSLSDDSK